MLTSRANRNSSCRVCRVCGRVGDVKVNGVGWWECGSHLVAIPRVTCRDAVDVWPCVLQRRVRPVVMTVCRMVKLMRSQ